MPVCFAMQPLNYQLCSCRPSKPVRDLDMIMQKEQQIAGVVTKADADKMIAASAAGTTPAAAAQIDLTLAPAQAASTAAEPASTAGQLLPSTEELQEQMWDVSAFSHSEEVELANTDEVLDMFSSYFEADVADAESRGSRISKDNIDTNLDFNSKVLDANYVAGTAPSLLAQTQGDHVSSFDVMQFVHTG